MTLLGEIFGYDSRDNDLLGYPHDPQYACLVCGVSSNAHTPQMEAECLRKIFGGQSSSKGSVSPSSEK